MNKLSAEIWIKIFEYDNTFHLKFKDVINEFHKKTSFWKINKISIIYGTDKNYPYNLNYNEIIIMKIVIVILHFFTDITNFFTMMNLLVIKIK